MSRLGYSTSIVKRLSMTDAEQRHFHDLLDEIDRAFEARREVDMHKITHRLEFELAERREEQQP